ncbi:hypothetical protein [Foetidibacter luteolus]|uniref:hypothetical protein n=1 Tax=Foetidibacter luteolus TaxID=2608880 RepID=UPI00129B145A|nr:hypothetical protein [Foetidibacter luteolus]
MKLLILTALTFLTGYAYSQSYPFVKDFVSGTIIFKDSSTKAGQIKWFPHQNEKLKFREHENAETIKYSPEEIAGFSADTLLFVSLYNFEAFSGNYPLLGKTTHIKHTFGELIDRGKFNIYLVVITGYDAIGGAIQIYPNFLFQNTQDSNSNPVAYPFAIRMRDKKYDKAKVGMQELFKDYPEIVEKINSYKQQDDFYEIINMVKMINRK